MAKYYFTTPIYYVNARPHIGHTYTTIVADTIARYRRMRGDDVVFLTGTDEHGQKVERAAKAAGVTPLEYADRISAEYRRLWDQLDLKYDRFIRTTEWRHERAVHNLLLKARDAGYIYKGFYEGLYCVSDEFYVDEPTPEGNCPLCGRQLEKIREENYYFKLSAFTDRLLQHYEQHPEFIQPETRRNEVLSFVRGGLRDLSVSRTSIKWGIPWPDDEKHVIYVWYDALTSYMSGIGYGDDEVQYEKTWPAELHLIGKEIIRFHAVYWPAFLMAADEPLPKQIVAHGWWTFEGEKMSKSRGNIRLAQPAASVLGIDALRYFLLREMVFGQDGSFSLEAVVARYNSDLANGLGNFASRVLAMIEQYFAGLIPEPPAGAVNPFANEWREAAKIYQQSFESFAFSQGLQEIWKLVASADKYLADTKPWSLATDASRRGELAGVLYNAAELLRIVAVLAYPVLPHATEKIWAQLGLRGSVGSQRLQNLAWGDLRPGEAIQKGEAVFPRVQKEEAIERMEQMEEQIRAEGAPKPAEPAKPATAAPAAAAPAPAPAGDGKIAIEDFMKVELRVGEIKSAERIPGADKILKLMVDIGTEVRQIVAGIAQFYEPDKLVGRRVVVVVNLAPRKLRGVESNGMVVAANVGPENRPVLAGFHEDAPVGSRLK
ncbi:MAG TPA: methionine--tRNA ligase [Candidatus Acidoferrales bacterium]|nr:methionine--tRNA ligase [Candidatus Acidoferrales bacterium]